MLSSLRWIDCNLFGSKDNRSPSMSRLCTLGANWRLRIASYLCRVFEAALRRLKTRTFSTTFRFVVATQLARLSCVAVYGGRVVSGFYYRSRSHWRCAVGDLMSGNGGI